MSKPRFVACMVVCLALAFGTGSATRASEALQIGERGGFLLGQAFRCGVAETQLDAPAKLIRGLIDGGARSVEDKTLADQAFAEQFIINIVTPSAGGGLPSCPVVRRELSRLVQHRTPIAHAGRTPEAQVAQVRLSKSTALTQMSGWRSGQR